MWIRGRAMAADFCVVSSGVLIAADGAPVCSFTFFGYWAQSNPLPGPGGGKHLWGPPPPLGAGLVDGRDQMVAPVRRAFIEWASLFVECFSF